MAFLVWTQALTGGVASAVLFLVAAGRAGRRPARGAPRAGRAGRSSARCSRSRLAVAGLFAALFPDVMPSSTNPAWSLTTTNASATDYTLTVMTWVAVIFTPLVLLYQSWTYWVFRQRIAMHHIPVPVG